MPAAFDTCLISFLRRLTREHQFTQLARYYHNICSMNNWQRFYSANNWITPLNLNGFHEKRNHNCWLSADLPSDCVAFWIRLQGGKREGSKPAKSYGDISNSMWRSYTWPVSRKSPNFDWKRPGGGDKCYFSPLDEHKKGRRRIRNN